MPPKYSEDFIVRRVRSNGQIKLLGKKLFISQAIIGESVGIQQVNQYIAKIYFYHQPIIVLDLRDFSVINDQACYP